MSSTTQIQFKFAEGLPITQRALAFARQRHGDQHRDADGATFLVHPVEVAALLARRGYGDEVVAAAVLHDVLEDTDVQRGELEADFGAQVAELVALVSDDPAVDDEDQRKDEVRRRVCAFGGEGLAVYAADKVSKVRELRMLLAGGLDRAEAEVKIRRHRRSLAMLEGRLEDRTLVELLRFELESLEQLPPERSG